MSETPEFSRPVLLARIGPTPFQQEISASEQERAALAGRLDLLSLDRLSARVELARRGSEMILLRASFEAEFMQACVVTLDPVPGAASEQFSLLYGPPELEETSAGVVGDTVAFEPLLGDAIDIGEAVAQELSLVLPTFPRCPEAGVPDTPGTADSSPFAGLAALLDRDRRDP